MKARPFSMCESEELVAQLCLTLCYVIAHQASLSMEFSMQEYWDEVPFPIPRDLPDPGIELVSFGSPALAGGFFTKH